MFDQNFYKSKIDNKVEQLNKIVNRLIEDIYSFVKQREELVRDINQIQATIADENSKAPKTAEKQADENKPAGEPKVKGGVSK